ncbi:hypothetical protein OG792_25085 [Micromonospora sp. NBC_01699]|uniref:hypothetical protein n=1 Tax=Micromonospora sp. NBC_01699 TaxID=2975984 RepID=UPI002E28613F|nr:hypothetical protein [Micromonospora sp. NBC_01699]
MNTDIGPRAVRAALVGLTVAVLLHLSLAYAQRRMATAAADPEIEGLAVLAGVVVTTVLVWVPSALVVGWLVGWAARLEHPIVVSFVGMVGTGLLTCLVGRLAVRPGWLLPSVLIVATYAVTPLLVDLLWTKPDPKPAPPPAGRLDDGFEDGTAG